MSDQGFHVGPTVPISLAAAGLTNNARMVDLGQVGCVTLQASMFTSPTYLVHFRIGYSAALAATTLATAEHCLGHLGTRVVQLSPTQHSYLYVFVTDANGTGADGGAADRVNVLAVA